VQRVKDRDRGSDVRSQRAKNKGQRTEVSPPQRSADKKSGSRDRD